MRPIGGQYFAILAAVCFAAGLNVYATVASLGLLARAGAIVLPAPLHALESWWIIGASAVLFLVEFFGDKIPAFDLIWNALHTFVRVPVAALIAYLATAQLSPGEQALSALAGGVIALAAHGGKTAARIAVTPSPEPLSNIGLSLGEDVLAIFLVWFATKHPYAAAAIVLVGLVIVVVTIRFVWRALRLLFVGAEKRSFG
ncbi:MAG TPA: DUF4126 domain-containing protein [Candidatus Acidoferrales bacterium]|nr:DUF4126 domain-containing protein [Candidatus Acidoferrales bacterium]